MTDQLFPLADGPAPADPAWPPADAPLAARMRPRSLEELVGQEHLLGTEAAPTALRRAIAEGRPPSMVLHGPPGTGKTTLARLVAHHARADFEELSAVEAGRAEVRAVLERAEHRRAGRGEPTIFFLDEIHRFNKAQQDALLPAVEEGLVTLIGATTQNPYFEVNSSLLSRARVYELRALAPEGLEEVLRRALAAGACQGVSVADEAVAFLSARSAGDARTALGALELACESGAEVTLALAEEALQRKALRYDRAGDQHFDYISAYIKATRASDPDAALYYLAVMLEGGEDPRFLARRMIVLASEDVGGAEPSVLPLAVAAAGAVEHVGMPECAFALAQCTIHLALAPKSDAAARAWWAARDHVRRFGASSPPDHLRSGAYPAAKALGRGQGYDNPHDHPGHLSPQQTMPDELAGERFYRPDDAEAALAARVEQLRRVRHREEPPGG
ncbi:MAG: replication-associated recombination protein A [Actinomycetota bacterium]|nr:replication-associated recombination protein A [Actinomycetota bacterium]